jgi:hypothetical protein
MKLSFVLFVAAVLCSSMLRASTLPVYSNFDGEHPYDQTFGLTVKPSVAVPFFVPETGVPGFEYALSDIEFVAFTSDLSANPVTVALFDTTNGGLPGAQLEPLDVSLSATPGVITVTSASHPRLVTGKEYWIVLSDPVPYAVVWNADGNGALGAASLDNGEWAFLDTHQQGAVQVNATLVAMPEPSSFLLLFGGLTGGVLAGIARRNQLTCSES